MFGLRVLSAAVKLRTGLRARRATLVQLSARPNYRNLGQRFKKQTEAAAQQIRALDEAALRTFRDGGAVSIEVDGETWTLEPDDLAVEETAEGDWVVRSDGAYTVALDPTLTDELRSEGLARELINRIQRLRRDSGLEITDRIDLGIAGDASVQAAAREHQDVICGETLATNLSVADMLSLGFDHTKEVELDDVVATLGLARTG